MKKVERNDLSEIGRLKRNEYMRKWSSKNKDKVKANYDSYWSSSQLTSMCKLQHIKHFFK